MRKGEPLPLVHKDASVLQIVTSEGSPYLAIETSEAQWSFAVSFELGRPKNVSGIGVPRVVIDLEVEAGEVGIGCTTADYSSFVDREALARVGMRRKIYVPTGAPDAALHLTLRNVSPNGRSALRVHGIEVRSVSVEEEIRETLRSLGPVGPAAPHNAALVHALGPRVAPPGFQPTLIETDHRESSNAASFRLTMPLELSDTTKRRVIVDLEVESGVIGIGCMNSNCSSYFDREVIVPSGPQREAYVPTGAATLDCELMFRNLSGHGRSVVRIHGITLKEVTAEQERKNYIKYALWDVPLLAPQRPFGHAENETKLSHALANLRAASAADVSRFTFRIALTHTTRAWEWERCTRDFLRNRYERVGRLDGLPPFDQLPPAHEARSYAGHLSLFDLTIDAEGIYLTATQCIDSHDKIQHACFVGDKLVICLEDCIIIRPAGSAGGRSNAEQPIERIDDPWFAGLHTVFPVDDVHCVISASAPDAVLLLDLRSRCVVWRWRVPVDRYGRNYELTDSMSVQDHHIANDIQLAHLNCAYPDGAGGFWISTLGQGDIAHVSANGDYKLVTTGFVGCHGVRYSRELNCLYFSDSCTGRLIGIGADRFPRTIATVDSRWLHDAQHLAGNIFLLCLGDKNAIVLLNTSSDGEFARFDMKSRGENVQFVSLIGRPNG